MSRLTMKILNTNFRNKNDEIKMYPYISPVSFLSGCFEINLFPKVR